MKKLILLLAICLGVSFSITSCKKDKKEEVKIEVKEDIRKEVKEIKTDTKVELASNMLYQCPMDCEKGKSYIKEGACPVCKMELKAKEVHLEENGHEGHDHD